MFSFFKSVSLSFIGSRAGVLWAVCVVLLLCFSAIPASAQEVAGRELPRILMIDHDKSSPNSDDEGLYKAIRAQLSASPVWLDRIPEAPGVDATQIAPRLAAAYRAAMVFWIEDGESCRIYFFIPDAGGGRVSSREMVLDLSSESSRYEVIAVVASGMIEGLLVSRQLANPPASKALPPPNTPKPEENPEEPPRRWLELFAAYSGAYLADAVLSHGVTFGLWGVPLERFALGGSFTQNGPYTFSGEVLRLKTVSRQIEVSAAVRFWLAPVDLRLGVSWNVDMRSLSTTAVADTVDARSDEFVAVNSIAPFIFFSWVHRDRFGLFGRVGTSIALNEPVYKMRVADEAEAVFKPFVAKLFFQFGLMVRL